MLPKDIIGFREKNFLTWQFIYSKCKLSLIILLRQLRLGYVTTRKHLFLSINFLRKIKLDLRHFLINNFLCVSPFNKPWSQIYSVSVKFLFTWHEQILLNINSDYKWYGFLSKLWMRWCVFEILLAINSFNIKICIKVPIA